MIQVILRKALDFELEYTRRNNMPICGFVSVAGYLISVGRRIGPNLIAAPESPFQLMGASVQRIGNSAEVTRAQIRVRCDEEGILGRARSWGRDGTEECVLNKLNLASTEGRVRGGSL